MSPELLTELLRYTYAVLAFLAATGFVATLIVRWDVLYAGEKILRGGLILEHLVIMYGAYIALKPPSLPPSAVAPLLCLSLLIMLFGFLVWAADLRAGRLEPRRLTD